jgi:hypothetical protein
MSETESPKAETGLSLSNAMPIVGVIHVGGCGDFTMRQLIEDITPSEYPGWLHLAANTDAKSLKHNLVSGGKAGDDSIHDWESAKALEILQLGADEVTKGFGTGADPAIGRKAALTKDSQERLKAFIDKVHFLFIEGAVGGGTGTGVIPVIAKMAVDMDKPAWAIVVVPDPGEGRDERALPALAEIRKLVPTSAIQNSYIDEYLDELEVNNPGSSDDKTYLDMFKLVNEKSNLQIMKIGREIVQGIGRGIHKDLNDLKTQLKKGKRPFFGVTKVKRIDAKAKTAEELAREMLKGEFQDKLIITEGVSIGFWAVGPWGYRKVNKTRDLMVAEVIKNRPELKGKIEVFPSINFDDDGKEMWMAVLIVAPENPSDPHIASSDAGRAATGETAVEQPAMSLVPPMVPSHAPAPAAALAQTGRIDQFPKEAQEASKQKPSKVEAESTISFYSDGIKRTPLVPYPLLTRFNRDYRHDADPETLKQLLDDIEAETKGWRPDLPEEPQKKGFLESVFQGVGLQRRLAKDNGGPS